MAILRHRDERGSLRVDRASAVTAPTTALGEYLRRRERDPRGASPTQVPDADSRRGKMGTDSCDVSGAAFFVAALVAGTGCTICSKALFQV